MTQQPYEYPTVVWELPARYLNTHTNPTEGKPLLTRKFLLSTLYNAAVAFLTTFVGQLVAPINVTTLEAAASAGIAAALAALLSAFGYKRTGTTAIFRGVK
jgi:hypothetical protein